MGSDWSWVELESSRAVVSLSFRSQLPSRLGSFKVSFIETNFQIDLNVFEFISESRVATSRSNLGPTHLPSRLWSRLWSRLLLPAIAARLQICADFHTNFRVDSMSLFQIPGQLSSQLRSRLEFFY